MTYLTPHCDDTISARKPGDDKLRAVAAERLARLIAENLCEVLSSVPDKVLARIHTSICGGNIATSLEFPKIKRLSPNPSAGEKARKG